MQLKLQLCAWLCNTLCRRVKHPPASLDLPRRGRSPVCTAGTATCRLLAAGLRTGLLLSPYGWQDSNCGQLATAGGRGRTCGRGVGGRVGLPPASLPGHPAPPAPPRPQHTCGRRSGIQNMLRIWACQYIQSNGTHWVPLQVSALPPGSATSTCGLAAGKQDDRDARAST